ncbi:MAG TPA: hypothetical protein VHP11_00355 [Tepidisphaeraceae bacterium]|nr:hypothetical protein [Tepidisphaeraceae bacterium]
MLTQTSARNNTTSDDIGFSVFASVDGRTLETLNRCADEEVLPRSWLIGKVLKEWAMQRHDSRSDTVTVEEGQERIAVPDAVEQIIAGGGSMLDLARRRELTHNS